MPETKKALDCSLGRTIILLIVSAESPNIFNALFDLHPTEKHSQNENFLSEAFAHVLKTVPSACEAWVNKICRDQVRLNPGFEITTRASEAGDEVGSHCYPDLKIKAQTESGQSLTIFAEHKWGSRCDQEQLRIYGRRAKEEPGSAVLAFVGARVEDREKARNAETSVPCACFLWEDVYETLRNDLLDKHQQENGILEQFLDFMKAKGLSPGEPLTVEQMRAYIVSQGFMSRLMRYAQKLNIEYSWDAIPKRYRGKNPSPSVSDRDGRVSIWFGAPGWSSAIFVGFLCDAKKHQVSFTAPQQGIDLMLIVWCDPHLNPEPSAARSELDAKASALEALGVRVLLKGDPGNRSDYALLISQVSLASVIAGKPKEREQLDAIHAKLIEWLDALFQDGKLDSALKALKGHAM